MTDCSFSFFLPASKGLVWQHIGLTNTLLPSSFERNLVQMFRNNPETTKAQICHELAPAGTHFPCPQFYVTTDWGPWSTFKLDWNLQLFVWTRQMSSGLSFDGQLRQRSSCLDTKMRKLLGGVKVRLLDLREHCSNCKARPWYHHPVVYIKEDYFWILQLHLTSWTVETLTQLGPTGQAHIKPGFWLDQSGFWNYLPKTRTSDQLNPHGFW